MTEMSVLLVEDDQTIVRTLRISLRARGHEVRVAGGGQEALRMFHDEVPDIVLLDLGLPDLGGVEVLRRIRQASEVPVVVLTARNDPVDKVEALDEGADDYVTKPFNTEELFARMRAAVRRGSPPGMKTPPPVTTEHFTLDFDHFHAEREGAPVRLTPTEWRLLAELARRPGVVIPHAQLLHSVWGPSYGREANYLRVYANQLRRKLEPDPAHPRYLVTEPGLGYCLRTR